MKKTHLRLLIITMNPETAQTSESASSTMPKTFKVKDGVVFFSKDFPAYYELLNTAFGSGYDPDYDLSFIYPIDSLMAHLSYFEGEVKDKKHVECQELVDFLKDQKEKKEKRLEACRETGEYPFELLSTLFNKDTLVMVNNFQVPLCGKVHESCIRQDMMGSYLVVVLHHYACDGTNFTQFGSTYYIDGYQGFKKMDELDLKLPSEDDRKKLLERFERVSKYLTGNPNYLMYEGKSYKRTYFGKQLFSENGRVMFDHKTFATFNPNYPFVCRFDSNRKNISFKNNTLENNKENLSEEVRMCFYSIAWGYSFSNKEWLEFYLENCSPIQFDKEAYDLLVMDSQKKEMTKALLLNHDKSFKDIIRGKSGGCIFLLHGPPGTGKTLTCEAVSDLLEKPLYVVSVAELGTTPVDLENNLKKILVMANNWKAVLLFDEADIFMERRSLDNIQRNAMVSIFLRLLEKNDGVIFLTTNRADTIDEAFRSRITVSFEYEKLNVEARRQIWKNLLAYSEIDHSSIDIDKVSQLDVNGRQIKNLIRTAQTLAISRNVPIDMNIMETCVQYI